MSRRATGLRAWILQRVTAVFLGIYTIYLYFHFMVSPPAGFEQWQAWVADPVIGISLLLFIFSLLLHAWVGMRDVLIDYVKSLVPRVSLLSLLALGLVACGLWSMKILFLLWAAGG
jgi:succinate dehydrogenase / fumarate reductase membrane anchor subunit